jgi:hypothetical protein
LVFVDSNRPKEVKESEIAKDESLVGKALSFFSSGKEVKTQSFAYGAEHRIDPIFVLWLNCVKELVTMNSLSFEFTESYILFMATELHTNRFWEFI